MWGQLNLHCLNQKQFDGCIFTHCNLWSLTHLVLIYSPYMLSLQAPTVSERVVSAIQTRAGMVACVRRLLMDTFANASGGSQASAARPPLRLTSTASLTDVNWMKSVPRTNLWGHFIYLFIHFFGFLLPNASFCSGEWDSFEMPTCKFV